MNSISLKCIRRPENIRNDYAVMNRLMSSAAKFSMSGGLPEHISLEALWRTRGLQGKYVLSQSWRLKVLANMSPGLVIFGGYEEL